MNDTPAGVALAITRAMVVGLLVGIPAANVWTLLLAKLGAPAASVAEVAFLAAYLWWVSGGGPPAGLRAARADRFRNIALTAVQWRWGVLAALSFAATVHASIVLVFRFTPFPAQDFHQGYDLSFVPTQTLRWLVCVVSALSAAVCEETGFRGYIQRPIETRAGVPMAVLISSLCFMYMHLGKSWSLLPIVPIVFGAGVLLGVLARASGTLLFGMLGHWVMDIGLFAYWWTQIAGTFSERPVWQSGWDRAFLIECGVFVVALATVITAIARLSRSSAQREGVRASGQ